MRSFARLDLSIEDAAVVAAALVADARQWREQAHILGDSARHRADVLECAARRLRRTIVLQETPPILPREIMIW